MFSSKFIMNHFGNDVFLLALLKKYNISIIEVIYAGYVIKTNILWTIVKYYRIVFLL